MVKHIGGYEFRVDSFEQILLADLVIVVPARRSARENSQSHQLGALNNALCTTSILRDNVGPVPQKGVSRFEFRNYVGVMAVHSYEGDAAFFAEDDPAVSEASLLVVNSNCGTHEAYLH